MVNVNIALTVSLHGEFVKNALGGLLNTEDHDLIDDLGGSLGVKVLVADRLSDLDILAIEVVTNLSSFVVPVVVVLTVVKVEVTSGVRVLEHGVSVDLETDWVLDSLEERLTAIVEVQNWKDRSTSDEGALLSVGDVHETDFIHAVDLKLRVHVVPLGGWWEIDLDLGGGTSDSVLDARVANLGADEDVRSEHELMVEIICQFILRVLVPHRADYGKTSS